jgi:adenylate kinase
VELLDIPHVSTGDMLRDAISKGTDLGRQAQQYMQAGDLVPDQLVLQIIGARLDEPELAQGCLFDGFPRNVDQARSLDELLAARSTPLHMAMELQVDNEELTRRMLARKRQDDTPETIAQRLEVYANQTAPVLQYYADRQLLVSIDGSGTPEEVFERIKSRVQ